MLFGCILKRRALWLYIETLTLIFSVAGNIGFKTQTTVNYTCPVWHPPKLGASQPCI